MADVLVTRGSDTWVWRFPGSDEELVAAVAAGCFPPAGDYEGTASKVDRPSFPKKPTAPASPIRPMVSIGRKCRT